VTNINSPLSRILIWKVRVALLGVLALLINPLQGIAQQISLPTYWLTQGWRTAAPEEEGFDSAKLAKVLLTIQEKDIDIRSL
jgi:hypothetical protein